MGEDERPGASALLERIPPTGRGLMELVDAVETDGGRSAP